MLYDPPADVDPNVWPRERFRVVEVVAGPDKVKHRAGAKDASMNARLYMKRVALPLTDADARSVERRVDAPKVENNPVIPPLPPNGPR